jgi:hypothetical protein
MLKRHANRLRRALRLLALRPPAVVNTIPFYEGSIAYLRGGGHIINSCPYGHDHKRLEWEGGYRNAERLYRQHGEFG